MNRAENSKLFQLVQAFREHGHRWARLNPLDMSCSTSLLSTTQRPAHLLNAQRYGLGSAADGSSVVYNTEGILNVGPSQCPLVDIVAILQKTYCGTIGLEFAHLEDEEKEWFSRQAEIFINNLTLTNEDRKVLATIMLQSQVFDNFVATKFPTVKRYGGEGAESMLAFFHKFFSSSAASETEHLIMCMPHRGRLNLLTTLLKYPPVLMFRKMKGMKEFPDNIAAFTGDVLSHLTSSVDLEFNGDKKIHVTMIPNPSHLEAVNPVAVGEARGRKLDANYELPSDRVSCLQVHGDAAFAAQGIIQELFALANVPHFTVDGSVHLIVNNQIGFTTPAERGRSSTYCSDVAKMIDAPAIHVNGGFPEDVIRATALAHAYRQRFHKDVVVDLVCFRRWGHNEMDDPTLTNPLMYDIIERRPSVPDEYAGKLTSDGILSDGAVGAIKDDYFQFLSREYDKVDSFTLPPFRFSGNWAGFARASSDKIGVWDTGVDTRLLQFIGAKSVQVPLNFNVHPQLVKTLIEPRLRRMQASPTDKQVDWATAESLAIGSLLYQGFQVRLSGQDVGRGTFSQRHAMLVCQTTGDQVVPLNHLSQQQTGFFEVANSILSEEAVLGFEYGMSVGNPRHLIIWEAQFGDFFNGAQVIVDAFIVSGETKWLQPSGLVMLLPHGYDGAGPEHSSCRIERFLQLCDSSEVSVDGDNTNFQLVHPTTAAQYFHLLRRQMVRDFRKPLVVVAPKLLLRLPAAASRLHDLAPGTTFSPVLPDTTVDRNEDVSTIIFCSGKHYYALDKQRIELGRGDTAIVRLEALCPFPTYELQTEVKKYPAAKKFIWSQEEHRNMGAWSFVSPRFQNLVGVKVSYCGRGPLATPAVGIRQLHEEESRQTVVEPFQK